MSVQITPDVEGAYTVSAFCGAGKSSIIIDASDVRISALYYQLPSGEWRLVSRGEWLLQGTLVSFKAISNTPDKAFPPGKPFWCGAAAGKNGSIVTATVQKAGAGPFSAANGPPDSMPTDWLLK